MPNIGGQLAELRRRRKLTIRDLAARSGISHSTISLIERNRTSPSVDTLAAIVDALGTTLTGFFTGSSYPMYYSSFYREEDLVEIGQVAEISYKVIGANFPNRQMLVLRETYRPGADTGEVFSHTAQEGGIVLAGAVEVTVGGETRVLNPGDAYYFDSSKPHRFRNVSEGESVIISAVTPPTY